MTWRDQCISDLRIHEGCRLVAYWDEIGKCWTVGYGNTDFAHEGLIISTAQAEQFLFQDVATAESDLDQHAVWWKTSPDPVRRGLLNMSFEMGWPRLSGFEDMIEAGKDRDYIRMSAEALASHWAKQVPTRAEFIAGLFHSAARDMA